jgi:hypothetical protein
MSSRLKVSFKILVVSATVALPHGFLMVFNQQEKDCDASDFFKSKFFNTSFTNYQVYFTFIEPVMWWGVPGILITIFNFYVIYKIYQSNKSCANSFGSIGRRNCNSLLVNSKHGKSSRRNSALDTNANNVTSEKPNTHLLEILEFNEDHQLNTSNLNNKMRKSSQSYFRKISSVSTISFDYIKVAVNQISHYFTIMMVGFYFIATTIPFGIMLSIQNNLTLKLNYRLKTRHDYLNDQTWISYGNTREWAFVTKLFFVSNHCFNFFLYLLFNDLFRDTFFQLIVFKMLKPFWSIFKCTNSDI